MAGAAVLLFGQESAAPLRFVILGDRMGEVVAGKYEAVWKAIEAEKPAFVVGVETGAMMWAYGVPFHITYGPPLAGSVGSASSAFVSGTAIITCGACSVH